MLRLLFLLLTILPYSQGQGCPICGPEGAAWYAGVNPPGEKVVQAAQDDQPALTCDWLYDTFELQINNYRIGEYSCTWAKWTATQRCDCRGQKWSWPPVQQNKVCDVCGQVLDEAYEGQPMGPSGAEAYYGMTCDGAIMGGFNRALNDDLCAGAKTYAAAYCGCGGGGSITSSPPPPAPTPAPAPQTSTSSGNTSQCKVEGTLCTSDYNSCCGECKAISGSNQRYCGPAPSTFDSGTGSRQTGGGSGRGATPTPTPAPTPVPPVSASTSAPAVCWDACPATEGKEWVCKRDSGCEGCDANVVCPRLCNRCSGVPPFDLYGGLSCSC